MLIFKIQHTKYFHNLLLLILKYKIQNIFICSYEIQNIFMYSEQTTKYNCLTNTVFQIKVFQIHGQL